MDHRHSIDLMRATSGLRLNGFFRHARELHPDRQKEIDLPAFDSSDIYTRQHALEYLRGLDLDNDTVLVVASNAYFDHVRNMLSAATNPMKLAFGEPFAIHIEENTPQLLRPSMGVTYCLTEESITETRLTLLPDKKTAAMVDIECNGPRAFLTKVLLEHVLKGDFERYGLRDSVLKPQAMASSGPKVLKLKEGKALTGIDVREMAGVFWQLDIPDSVLRKGFSDILRGEAELKGNIHTLHESLRTR